MTKRKKVIKKTKGIIKNKNSFEDVRATIHEFGKQARAVLEEGGCSVCKKGEERFVYTSTYIRKKRVFIEVICKTCGKVHKVSMPELSLDDV